MMISVVMTMTILVGLPINKILTNMSKQRLQMSYQQLIKERANIMSMTMDNVFKLCDEIVVNDRIYNALCNYDQLSTTELLRVHNDITDFISSKYYFMNSIHAISIVTEDGKILFDAGYNTSSVRHIEKIIEDANNAEGQMVWSYVKQGGKNQANYIVASKAINYRFKSSRVGYLIVFITESYFRDLFDDLYIGENGKLAVIDTSHTAISSANGYCSVDSKLDFLPEENDEVWNKENYFIVDTGEEKSTMVYAKIKQTNWKLIGLIDNDYLNSESKAFQKVLLSVAIVALVLCIIIFIVLSNSIFKPLDSLISHMRNTETKQLKEFVPAETSGEIVTLSKAYNSLIKRINSLIEEIKINEMNKHEMKIQLLQAQINPHFLFNTLDSLKWVSLMSRCDNVADGINALTDLLRSTISKKEYVTIQEEMNNIQSYSTIMKIRFNEFFDVKIKISKELIDTYILKMLLQPIVENAIIHGISNLEYKGVIEIVAFEESDNLIVRVKDNGVGFNPNVNFEIPKNTEKHKSYQIGMKNVQERIRLYFGEQYGYEIFSQIGQGTEVRFTLPIIKEINQVDKIQARNEEYHV